MIKEIFATRKKMTKLSVTNNEITAVLRSDSVKTGLRLYADGCIGIAGAIGAYDENELVGKAKNMLKYKVTYDCKPAENISKKIDLSDRFTLNDEQFIKTSAELLDALKAKYPSFSYSNIIRYVENETSLKNEHGADLAFIDKYVSLELVMKHKSSANLMDGFAINVTRMYDFDDAFRVASEVCEVYEEKSDFETEEKIPVVFLEDHGTFLGKFMSDLHGERFGTNTSLFSGKTGQKLFSDKFSLFVDRNPVDTYDCFFDGEGTTLVNDKFILIENGVLKAPYSSKKVAKKYNLPVTSSASMVYDAVPSTEPSGITVASSGKTIKELLGGKKGVYVVSAGGGDFTAQGEYASPIQTAYYFDGEKLCGRLPQLAMSSNVFDMFGDDFIGRSTDGYSKNNPFTYLAVNMTVKKIGGHM